MLSIVITAFVIMTSFSGVHAQSCPTDLLQGQNIVANGDFSSGYTGWTYTPDSDGNPNTGPDGYIVFNPPATQSYSQPGFIYAGSSQTYFNSTFTNFTDHSSSSDNNMLMVDGVCTANIKLWSQSGIPIKANTAYYFGVWIATLKSNPTYQGHLRFDINGTDLLTDVAAPSTAGNWIFFETVWNSGPTPPATVTISIENTTTSGCTNEVDFAIDDISFIPGCNYASAQLTPKPDLGADKTICGTGGSITLDAGVPMTAGTTVTWWDGVSNTGATPSNYERTITTPGTYSVCVNAGGSCTVADNVVISGTYSVDLGPDLTLCYPTYATLDAVFTGTGVTYQWYREQNGTAGWQAADTIVNAKGQTFTANTPGTYQVEVNDPSCGIRTDEVVISSNAATPNNSTYCSGPSTVSVTGTGSYKWYSTFTKGTGTLLNTGSTYNVPATNLISPASYTYYVEDITLTAGSVGPATLFSGGISDWGTAGNESKLQLKINISTDLQITSLKIPYKHNASATNGTVTIEVRDANGNSFSPAKVFTSSSTSVPNTGSGTQLVQFDFTNFNLQRSWGPDLRLAFLSQSGSIGSPQWNDNVNPAYTYTSSPSGIMTVTGAGGANATNADYPYFYDINFSASAPCDRVPVYMEYNCELPVELISFDAAMEDEHVVLRWSTSVEKNNQYFNIERSADGKQFQAIGQVEGKGTTSDITQYVFLDKHPLKGINYYRLTQFDTDGKSSQSQVIYVKNSNDEVTVSPNPVRDVFNVSFKETAGSEIRLSLYNAFGKPVQTEAVTSGSGTFSGSMNMAELTSGLYFLHIERPEQTTVIRIIKE